MGVAMEQNQRFISLSRKKAFTNQTVVSKTKKKKLSVAELNIYPVSINIFYSNLKLRIRF